MNHIANFGLEFLTDTKEHYVSLCRAVCISGKAILGYYNRPYMNRSFGWPQFIVRTRPSDDGESMEMCGLDMHLSGVTKWTFRVGCVSKHAEEDDPLTRKVMAYNSADGIGAAMITIVNADVLPSFLADDEITAQMIGFPIDIHYYANEDAYADDQPEMLDGNKMLLADGTMMPVGLLSPTKDKTPEEENLMLIRGTVKKAQRGLVEFGEEKGWNYLDVIIATHFGDLEIVHTMEQVPESEQDLVKIGSVVNGLFYLSGDVAIGEYKEGCILDFEHNLALLRYTLQEGEAERLGPALRDDAEYISEWVSKTYRGKDEIISRFNYVKDANPDRPFFAHFATIIGVDEGDEELPYSVGDRCIVIAMQTEDNLESICFMECDEESKISKIVVTRNPRYHFKLDEKVSYPRPYEDEMWHAPQDVFEAIRVRAQLHRFVEYEEQREDIEQNASRSGYYEKVANAAVSAIKENPPENILEFFPKLFSCLFVKAIELQLQSGSSYSVDDFKNMDALSAPYEPKEADEDLRKRLSASYELGAQFYKDFAFYRERLQTEEGFEEDLITSLVFVQQIGEVYAAQKLKRVEEGD